ncbi:MAG TPA: hypothetical protein VKU41_27390 [Polyangiaceae bacterium]|nr:hypothetical protein [Polyangiaceae bacterium]
MRAIVWSSTCAVCVMAFTALTAGPSAAAGDAGAAHAKPDAGPRETAGQREYRLEYVEATVKRERELTAHKIWTPDMSSASWKHWRRAYRALRIRELAQDDHDDATVARVDGYLKKLTDRFLVVIKDLAASAPEVPPPPTLVAPTAGVALAVGTPVTFKMAAYKDAAHYYCWLWEPGGHYWSNWQASTESYGVTPECTIAADDPRWSRFHAGKAEFHGRAILSAKTSAGKDYKVWSEPVKAEFTLTGGAAPGPSGAPGGPSAQPPPPKPLAAGGGAK